MSILLVLFLVKDNFKNKIQIALITAGIDTFFILLYL